MGLDLKTYLENDMCYKETRLHSQNPSTMLDTIVDIIGKDPIRSFSNSNTHFNNEQDIHMSLINYKESDYGCNICFLRLLILPLPYLHGQFGRKLVIL